MAEVSEGFGVSRIGQIAMTVGDLPRAIAFYRDVLGLRFLFEAPPAMAFFDCGGVRLMLSLPEQAGWHAAPHLGGRARELRPGRVLVHHHAFRRLIAIAGLRIRGRPRCEGPRRAR